MSNLHRLGLTGSPFPLFPDPQRWFPLRSSLATLEHLHERLRGGDRLLVLTGPRGSGKSTLCARLLRDISTPLSATCITIPPDSSNGCLEQVLLSALSHRTQADREEDRHEAIIKLLLGRRPGRTPCLVIVDDAHHLPSRSLLFLHSLLAMHRDGGPVIRIILSGAEELLPRLTHPLFRALSSLPTHFASLQPMNAGETIAYIEHHLSLARLPEQPPAQPFSPEALGILVVDSAGLPGKTNQLCDSALHAAAQRGDTIVRPEDLGYPSAFAPADQKTGQSLLTPVSLLAGLGGMLLGAILAATVIGLIPIPGVKQTAGQGTEQINPEIQDPPPRTINNQVRRHDGRAHPPLSMVLATKPDSEAPASPPTPGITVKP